MGRVVNNSPFPTSRDEKLGDLFFWGGNSVFLVPERRISCRAKPTCGDRAKRGVARAKRGMKFVSEGTKNTEFLSKIDKSTSESSLLVGIELFSLQAIFRKCGHHLEHFAKFFFFPHLREKNYFFPSFEGKKMKIIFFPSNSFFSLKWGKSIFYMVTSVST